MLRIMEPGTPINDTLGQAFFREPSKKGKAQYG